MALLPVSEALERILAQAPAMPPETVDLRHAAARTLAAPIAALFDGPPFDASAMDGYAVKAVEAASLSTPLRLVGTSAAGRPFLDTLKSGETVRIFTGAVVPAGADAVILQEDSTQLAEGFVSFREPPTAGQHVRKRGEDFRRGEVLIDSGRRLTSRDILLIATAGNAKVDVARRPKVAILSTGDELVEPGAPLAPGQIMQSNGYGLAALLEATGAHVKLHPIVRDTREALASAIADNADADILLTVGGASVGDHDLVRPALEDAGATLEFYKVAMRPGKPLFFGTRHTRERNQLCLGLPGNPVSSLICARVFLVPLIARMLGRLAALEPFDAIASIAIPANGPREHYMRASLQIDSIPPRVSPFSSQDSGRVSLLQKANCLIVVEPDMPAQPAGSTVKVLPLDF